MFIITPPPVNILTSFQLQYIYDLNQWTMVRNIHPALSVSQATFWFRAFTSFLGNFNGASSIPLIWLCCKQTCACACLLARIRNETLHSAVAFETLECLKAVLRKTFALLKTSPYWMGELVNLIMCAQFDKLIGLWWTLLMNESDEWD